MRIVKEPEILCASHIKETISALLQIKRTPLTVFTPSCPPEGGGSLTVLRAGFCSREGFSGQHSPTNHTCQVMDVVCSKLLSAWARFKHPGYQGAAIINVNCKWNIKQRPCPAQRHCHGLDREELPDHSQLSNCWGRAGE